MELTKEAVNSTAQQEIFSTKIKLGTYLVINKVIELKRSAKQRIVFLENANGLAIWIGKSIKSMFDLSSDEQVVALRNELVTNSRLYEIGVHRDSGNYIIYKAGNSQAETIATINMDEVAGATTVATVK